MWRRKDETWAKHGAFVTLKDDSAQSVTEADIIAFCRDNLAHFKVPRTVIFGPLPKTATGKIQKFALREKADAIAGSSGKAAVTS